MHIRELELLRETGFHLLEVIRAAALQGLQSSGWSDKISSIQIGKLADFVIAEENPLKNLKVLYGTAVFSSQMLMKWLELVELNTRFKMELFTTQNVCSLKSKTR